VFVACFTLNVLMVHSPEPAIITDGHRQATVGFALGETIHLGSLEFIANRFGRLSLSPERNDSDAVFIVMVHNGLLSLQGILEDSTDEDDTTSSGGGGVAIRLPYLWRVQRGDPYTIVPIKTTMDCHTTTRYWAPS
jgi:hypothetical protein